MSRIKKKRLIQARSSVTVKTDNEIILLPKQKEFLFLEDRFTALSGGFGSAKTFAGCMKGIILSALFPGNSGLVSRMTYPELRDSTRKTFLELVPSSWILSWNESFNTLLLKNGSQVIFRPIDDIRKQRSLNLGWFYIDQAEECTQEDFHDLAGRLRHPVPKQFGFCTVNPDGHNWVWQDFFNKPKNQYRGLNSTTFDNPYLPPGYIQSLIDAYPKEWVERFVYGSHEVRSGVIISEYSDDLQVDPFIIPSNWIKGRGMDWGIRAPCTRVSIALSPEGVFYIFDCYAKAELDPEEHAVNILERDRGIAYQMTKMDSAAWSRDGTTKDPSKLSPATRFIKAGVKMSPATRDFMGSLVNLKSLMKQGKIKFFRGQCDELVEEIKQWKWGKLVAGKEKPAVGNDHLCVIGETLVSTDKGNVPIKNISIGDMVFTRQGYKKVIASGITNHCAEVREYLFSNGNSIVATENHPVLTTEGFKPIGCLTPCDIICIIGNKEKLLCNQKSSCSKESNTEGTQTVKTKTQEIISDPPHGNQGIATIYIEKYGNTTKGKFQRDLLSTTKMVLGQTIGLKILNLKLTRSIFNTIQKQILTGKAINALNIFQKSGRWLLYGIGVKKAGYGIENTRKQYIYPDLKKSVGIAGKHIQQDLIVPDSAQTTVNQLTGERPGQIMKQEFAIVAEKILPQAYTPKQNIALKSVRLSSIGKKEYAPVYNISVEDCPEFIVDGIVLHNCDALRYIIFALTGRQSESIGPERKEETQSSARRIFIPQAGRASMIYDKTTGCPIGY